MYAMEHTQFTKFISVRNGFSLVELLMAMAIVGVLAGLVVVAINPTKQMADARNTQRKFDVNSILNAFGQYSVDSGGYFQPRKIDSVSILDECKATTTAKKLCKYTTAHGAAEGECGHVDVQCVYSAHLVNNYLANIPDDPLDDEDTVAEQAMVDYLVSSQSPGRFRVDAPSSVYGQTIGAMR